MDPLERQRYFRRKVAAQKKHPNPATPITINDQYESPCRYWQGVWDAQRNIREWLLMLTTGCLESPKRRQRRIHWRKRC